MQAVAREDFDPAAAIARLQKAIRSVVRGKDEIVDLALVAVLAGGHLLLEDVPGVGKTTLAASLARALGGSFSRVQFTSDLLPGDVTGSPILDRRTNELVFRPGPIFANVVLADELNRTSPKTQSALFEAMEEGTVTVDGTTHILPQPFFVVATQNPFDTAGTFALPDSQLDRFTMRLSLGYPSREAERSVLQGGGMRRKLPEPVLEGAEAQALQEAAEGITVATEIEDYLLDLVELTRTDARVLRGASTRGALALFRSVRANALVRGRSYAVPEDVHSLAGPVLGHRIVARSGDGEGTIRALLDSLQPPL